LLIQVQLLQSQSARKSAAFSVASAWLETSSRVLFDRLFCGTVAMLPTWLHRVEVLSGALGEHYQSLRYLRFLWSKPAQNSPPTALSVARARRTCDPRPSLPPVFSLKVGCCLICLCSSCPARPPAVVARWAALYFLSVFLSSVVGGQPAGERETPCSFARYSRK
jgi:hypothetical protein